MSKKNILLFEKARNDKTLTKHNIFFRNVLEGRHTGNESNNKEEDNTKVTDIPS